MKKLVVILLGLTFLSCATINQNIEARKNLAKCKYQLKKIELRDISIKKYKPKTIFFDVHLKIVNTTKGEVTIDSVTGDIFLDHGKIAKFEHKNFIRIPRNAFMIEKVGIKLPFKDIAAMQAKKPETITIKAIVFVNIMLGSYTLKTPIAIHVHKTFPVPYDKINAYIKKKRDKAMNTIMKKLLKRKNI